MYNFFNNKGTPKRTVSKNKTFLETNFFSKFDENDIPDFDTLSSAVYELEYSEETDV